MRAVHTAAFPTAAEADLVEALRDAADGVVSLVAEVDGVVVGHVMCSPATLDGHPGVRLMGLAPVAVLPARQRRGVGSALIGAALERCRDLGVDVVIVLGDPAYYARFGFAPAARWGVACTYDAPPDAFMATELRPGVLDKRSGTARYHPAFDALEG